MIFKKKLFNPKKRDLAKIEKELLNKLIENLKPRYAEKIIEQMKYLVLVNRVKYKSSYTIELYPEIYGSIPENLLFDRKEEFRLGVIKFIFDEQNYSSEIFMVSGRLFDFKIRPIPPKSFRKDATLQLQSIKLESNLDNNIN